MEFIEREFVPMIFGGDINTYSVSRAFYEEYQVKAHVFGKFASGPSYKSKILEYHITPDIDTDAGFMREVEAFCKEHHDQKVFLIGCGDNYIAMIGKHKYQVPENAVVPHVDYEMMENLQKKDYFYELCEKHGLDYPATYVYKKGMSLDFALDFEYPVILKPSESVTYWDSHYEGQEKVYFINNKAELDKSIQLIYDHGYESPLIIQDTVPGNDENMYVLTAYSNQQGKVEMMCLGHVLLEDHHPTGRGNHTVIITEFNEELMLKTKAMLEDIGYVGFSNFDIKYDTRDQKYKFFEINTRQGRSNYYVTGSGFNIAKYLVEDYVYGHEHPLELAKDAHLWMVVPKSVAFSQIKQPANIQAMKKLIQEGKMVNPTFNKGDYRLGRLYRLARVHVGHYINYRKY
ncbi:ATP-grasp domain-containing protein [Ohessyouella blattaphilus]|uniref:ATP-grasp domain-containing protein n=1 Tax=Ohessyouella blattaphilus TaxID=2949333 RepID=A0ABT1EJR8_9FIRM|nr:ATP-grasp domain-containing protein [Ohessyouella blattaphilus]MCP1109547.1 ATP-grasp domain-containing protein [Ohessyouella blattaphilus]MCR8562941.1 ATP-grasp domain-containing protein [Ohessyouella blattaphilus]MDL2250146.1 ATP-grasp domain-containing protein [Lachnospiraceae bacterium OttesenSCG-928-J05]